MNGMFLAVGKCAEIDFRTEHSGSDRFPVNRYVRNGLSAGNFHYACVFVYSDFLFKFEFAGKEQIAVLRNIFAVYRRFEIVDVIIALGNKYVRLGFILSKFVVEHAEITSYIYAFEFCIVGKTVFKRFFFGRYVRENEVNVFAFVEVDFKHNLVRPRLDFIRNRSRKKTSVEFTVFV